MEEFPVSAVEALCLGTSLTISGILYYVYRKKKKTVDKLKVSPGMKCNRMISHVIVSVEWFLTVFFNHTWGRAEVECCVDAALSSA